MYNSIIMTTREVDPLRETLDSLPKLSSTKPERVLAPGLSTREHSVEKSMLGLALAFNDLKGVSLMGTVAQAVPTQAGVTAANGEIGGLRLQMTRHFAGLIHEIFELLRQRREDFESEPIKRAVSKLPSSAQKIWAELLTVANSEGTANVPAWLTRGLPHIRNSIAFHYYDPRDLAAGFQKWFFDNPKGPLNEQAFYCDGQNLQSTRFFFADAAAQGALLRIAERHAADGASKSADELANDLVKIADTINQAVKPLLIAWLAREDQTS